MKFPARSSGSNAHGNEIEGSSDFAFGIADPNFGSDYHENGESVSKAFLVVGVHRERNPAAPIRGVAREHCRPHERGGRGCFKVQLYGGEKGGGEEVCHVMSNLVERPRTMARWIRFLNLNHSLGDWGEPAPLPPSDVHGFSLTPFCQGSILSYVEEFNARAFSFDGADALDEALRLSSSRSIAACNFETKLRSATIELITIVQG